MGNCSHIESYLICDCPQDVSLYCDIVYVPWLYNISVYGPLYNKSPKACKAANLAPFLVEKYIANSCCVSHP